MTNETLEEMVRRQLTVPVDTDTFKYAVALYQEAASARLQGAHIPPASGHGLHLTNVPLNRGMLAIVRETQHLSDDQRQALMMRVMHFGETLEAASADARFSAHLRKDDVGFEVSNELMDALAKTPYTVVGDHITADFDLLASQISGRAPT